MKLNKKREKEKSTRNRNHVEAKLHVDDEFYTRYEDVEKECSQFDFSEKKVYSPCDGPESAFVKYFEQPGKCKEFRHTSDDFRTHDDLFAWADVIVTNPPFSLKYEFFERIGEKDFLIVLPILTGRGIKQEVDGKLFWDRNRITRFSNTEKTVNCGWATNLIDRSATFYEVHKRLPKLIPEAFAERIVVAGKTYAEGSKTKGFPITEESFYNTVDNAYDEFIYEASAGFRDRVHWNTENKFVQVYVLPFVKKKKLS